MSACKYYDDILEKIEEESTDANKYTETKVLTGGSSSYYKVHVKSPTTLSAPYYAECNDIIEALQMNFAEGNIFKAIWRMAASRAGNGKPGTTYKYDSEKVEFFAKRLLELTKE